MPRSEDDHRTEDDEPLPPLPLESGTSFSGRRVVVIAAVAILAFILRVAIRAAQDENEAERPRDTTLVIDDPGAGLSPAERFAVDEALRRGEPLMLGADGRVRAARPRDGGAGRVEE